MKDKIFPLVLQNMIKFQGSANPKAILGPTLKHFPQFKSQVPNVLKIINQIIQELQGQSVEQLSSKLQELAPELLEQKTAQKIKGPLKPLKNAINNQVIVRIAPSPSGPLHIGHAYGALLNQTYQEMYHGKFILRIEDTNPANIYSPAYQMIEDDVNWLTGNKIDQIIIQSDRLEIYHKYIKQLVSQGDAYVCTCDPDLWREMKTKKAACSCRDEPTPEQLIRLDKMYTAKANGGYAEGAAVLRLKTDIEDQNPAMRDFSIARIVEHIHPRTKSNNHVWPLMVLSVAIDDHDLAITHVLNGKDHHDNGKKEAMIMNKLSWTAPEYQHWGRINFEGMRLSTSKTKIAIEEGEYTSWDDIRLATLKSLRRRGYQPSALKKFAIEIGLSLNDKTVSQSEFYKSINSFNKALIEPTSNRYFFVDNPIALIIMGIESHSITMDLHPEQKDKGTRTLNINESFLISKQDSEELNTNSVHRLIDCCNFIYHQDKSKFEFLSKEYQNYKNAENKGKIIHFLPNNQEQIIDAQVLLTDHTLLKGKIEKNIIKNQKVGDIVQLERRFFARIDKITPEEVTLWYLHK
jgi:glutamyl-tRNA synthetase